MYCIWQCVSALSLSLSEHIMSARILQTSGHLESGVFMLTSLLVQDLVTPNNRVTSTSIVVLAVHLYCTVLSRGFGHRNYHGLIVKSPETQRSQDLERRGGETTVISASCRLQRSDRVSTPGVGGRQPGGNFLYQPRPLQSAISEGRPENPSPVGIEHREVGETEFVLYPSLDCKQPGQTTR